MPIYSMTGYATSCSKSNPAENAAAPNAPVIHIEIRSVNSRFLDFNFRLPDELRACEPTLRTLISSKLKRGKVETRISLENTSDQITGQIPVSTLQNLARLSDIVRNWLPDVRSLSVTDVLRLAQHPAPLENMQEQILQLAQKSLDQLMHAREREGKKLGQSLSERVVKLRALAAQAGPLIPQLVEQQRQRFLERWQQIMQQADPQSKTLSADSVQERALTEATAFALRIDVAEELTRLASHLDEIDRLLAKGGEIGKRLDFLIQELHREANTLGSKSATIELTQISVEMKVLIEQMREQVQNID
jgi:uncharacterized protein (TIGR00255 family)